MTCLPPLPRLSLAVLLLRRLDRAQRCLQCRWGMQRRHPQPQVPGRHLGKGVRASEGRSSSRELRVCCWTVVPRCGL